MKITQSKIKDLMATLKVEVVEKDYRENVDKILKDYRKTAVIPGVRKGKTPMSIINKKYKTAVTMEEVNKILLSLGCKIKFGKKSFKVEVPSWRPDITQDIDLIEELIRIKGFDKIEFVSLKCSLIKLFR